MQKHDYGIEELRSLIRRLYIPDPDAGLRLEEEKKCRELRGFLGEVHQLLRGRSSRGGVLTVVDAAAGKGYVGVAIAALVGPRCDRPVIVHFLERDTGRLDAIREACAACGLAPGLIHCTAAEVGNAEAWPREPDLVVGLHACGEATDGLIEQATALRAPHILVAPCCVASWLPAARRAEERAADLGLPRHAEVRRRFVEACVLGERVLVLEAAGWETVTVPFVPPSVTPYNVLLRARRVGEPGRMRQAENALQRLRIPGQQLRPVDSSRAS